MALPTYFGSAVNPADLGSANEPVTLDVTPPASMVAGDLCILIGQIKVATTGQITLSATGGQTWNVLGETGANSTCVAVWWCEFTGSWGANPSLAFAAQSGTVPTTVIMHVFRPGNAAEEWVVNQAYSGAGFAAPSTPFAVSISGQTPTAVNTVAFAAWCSEDDNSWMLDGDVFIVGSGNPSIISGGTGGAGETNQARGQSFTAASNYNCAGVALSVLLTGTVTDGLFVEIAGTSINGTTIATSNTVAASTMVVGTTTTVYFAFPTPPALTSGTKYYLRIFRTGARDTTNNYTLNGNSGSVYAGGGMYIRDNNAWGTESGTVDLALSVYATGGFVGTNPSTYRNLAGSDQSSTFAYKIQETPAATGTVTNHQATLGGDAGVGFIATFASKMNLWAQSVL